MWPPEIGVVVVRAEGRDVVDLDAAAHPDRSEAVLIRRVRDQFLDALGEGIRGEVPIDRDPPAEHVPERAANHIGRVPVRPERLEQLDDGPRDRRPDRRLVVGAGQFRPRNR